MTKWRVLADLAIDCESGGPLGVVEAQLRAANYLRDSTDAERVKTHLLLIEEEKYRESVGSWPRGETLNAEDATVAATARMTASAEPNPLLAEQMRLALWRAAGRCATCGEGPSHHCYAAVNDVTIGGVTQVVGVGVECNYCGARWLVPPPGRPETAASRAAEEREARELLLEAAKAVMRSSTTMESK